MIENFVIDPIKPKTIATVILEAPRGFFPKRNGKASDYRKKCWRDKFLGGVYFLLSQEHFPAPGEPNGKINRLLVYKHRPA